MGSLFQELKRRKVFRVAVAYAVVAWVLIQISSEVLPALQMPEWTVSFVTVLLLLGFPVALLLGWAFELTPEGIVHDAVVHKTKQVTATADRNLIYVILGLVLLTAGFQIFDRYANNDSITANAARNQISNDGDSGVFRSSIELGQIEFSSGARLFNYVNAAISPDGRSIAHIGVIDGSFQLRLRNSDEFQFQVLIDSPAYMDSPLFSPDSQRLLLYSGEGLKVINNDGSSLFSIDNGTSAGNNTVQAFGFSWLDDENIIYASASDHSLYRTSIVDRQPEALPVEHEANEIFLELARLPDSNQILVVIDSDINPAIADHRIALADLTTGSKTTLIDNAYAPRYLVSGHIAFMREQALWVVPFDAETGEIRGAEYAAGIESIPASILGGFANFTVSSQGRLLYPDTQTTQPEPQLVAVDLAGNHRLLDLPPGNYRDPVLSPDGERLVLTLNESATSDLWVFNLRQNVLSKITFSGEALNPIWSVDGERLYYERTGGPGIWVINANGTGDPRHIDSADRRSMPWSLTPDGSQLLYMSGFSGAWDINALSLEDDEPENRVLLKSEYGYLSPAISPDGNWLAYVSVETGVTEIYLRPYPNLDDGKWQISNNTGTEPIWSPAGDVLYFVSYDVARDSQGIYSVALTLGADVEIGSPIMLASGLSVSGADIPNYAVLPGGEQFLAFGGRDEFGSRREVSLILVNNWFEELKRLAPSDSQ